MTDRPASAPLLFTCNAKLTRDQEPSPPLTTRRLVSGEDLQQSLGIVSLLAHLDEAVVVLDEIDARSHSSPRPSGTPLYVRLN
jgi:hypothetical protein